MDWNSWKLAMACTTPLRLSLVSATFVAASVAAQTPSVDVALSHVDEDHWRVRYEMAAPVTSLQLMRVPGDGRIRFWRSTDEAFELRHLPDDVAPQDVIRRKDGAAFDAVTFDLEARYQALAKDYAPFARFSDGGLLIHSGHFHACPTEGGCPAWPVTVTPENGAGVLALGRWSDGAATFASDQDGTFVYVGARKPIEGEHVIALVDAGFPDWARTQLGDLFPTLMAYYTDKMGVLETKPMLFASWDALDLGGVHAQGGTLPDQVMMHLQGPSWKTDGDAGWVAWFFAHEAAHLFQGRHNVESENAWIHEGSAEALAHQSLADLQAGLPSYLGAKRRTAFHRCAQFISKHPLRDAARLGAFQTYYDCGLHMHLAAAAAAERAGNGGVYAVWDAIVARANPNAPYDPENAFAAVAELGDAETAAFLRAIVEKAHPDDSAVFLREGLVAAGVDHRDVGP